MNLLLLSINPAAVPGFLRDCLGDRERAARCAYIVDAAEGMPFAETERAGLEAFGYELTDLSARNTDPAVFARVLDEVDAVYVASGETFVLLEALRSNGADEILVERVRAGLPYIGCSAGSVVAGPSVAPVDLMDDRALAPALTGDEGLHLIDRVIVPHADGRLPPYPLELIERTVATYGDRYPLLLLADDQALLVRDGVAEVIPSV